MKMRTLRRPAVATLALAAPLLFSLNPTASAQMRTGSQMKNYEQVFGLQLGNRHAEPLTLTLIESVPAGNVLKPGEQPAYKFLLKNNTAEPLNLSGKFDVIAYGTRGIPGDIWLPELYKTADLPAIPLSVSVPANGAQVLSVSAALPETFGAYALILDLGAAGRLFGTTCVRTFAAAPEKIQYPKLSLDDSVGLEVLHSLGVQAVRMGLEYTPTTHQNYAAAMQRLDAELQHLAEHNITVLVMFGAGPTEQPLGRARPHLTDDGVMRDTKQDYAWLPKDDPDFQKFVAAICEKHGWPRGPVTAVSLWNEPWEGISISGWGADMPRYREIYTALALGVEAARKTGADVLIGGCDSSGNTMDKLFGDGQDTFLKWLDVCTIHYQGMCAPVLYRKWLNRDNPRGRVKIWDTESWVANTDDRVATVIAANRAAGYDRAMGIYGGNISTPVKQTVTLPDGAKQKISTYHVWPPAAAVGAAQHFIGEREFRSLLFTNGLPWVMVFDGAKDRPDDGTVVIVGDSQDAFPGMLPFGDASPRPGATLTLSNPDHEFIAYDYSGNPRPADGQRIVVPLNHSGNFLRANGAPGSFERLLAALRAARTDGYPPLSIIARDLLAPVDSQQAALRLSLTNVLNRPVTGALSISLGELKLGAPATLDFKPHETRELSIPILSGSAAPDNTYPLALKFDAAADGQAAHSENLRVNYITKRSIKVDGQLDDWRDALPQIVTVSGSQGRTQMEAAWLPFEKFDAAQQPGLATAWLAHDEHYFYFAAKIADRSPSAGTLRYATRNDDDYYYPEVSYEYDTARSLVHRETNWDEPARRNAALFLPGSQTERSLSAWTGIINAIGFGVDLALPEGEAKTVTFYFVDWDGHQNGRRRTRVSVSDPATNKELAATEIINYGPGTYASFRLSGSVRVTFKPGNGFGASLSGIFFDADRQDAAKLNGSGTAAQFLGADLQTGAAWQTKYGQDGYYVIGSDAQYPAYAKVDPLNLDLKKEHRWPDGVRRYSYRKKPDLPFGSVPKFDNVQLAFNVIPSGEKPDMTAFPPGTFDGFIPHTDTDYEYALNQVADAHGGGYEVWRCFAPGMPRKTFYPRQGASPHDGAVQGALLQVSYSGNTRVVEAALPWAEIPLVKKAVDEGRPVKFTFRVNDSDGPWLELARNRSVARKNPYTFHPEWIEHWGNEVEFAFEK